MHIYCLLFILNIFYILALVQFLLEDLSFMFILFYIFLIIAFISIFIVFSYILFEMFSLSLLHFFIFLQHFKILSYISKNA
jgi:hypothetical protein